MTDETFFEHCLRRLKAGDTADELQNLLDKASEIYLEGETKQTTDTEDQERETQ